MGDLTVGTNHELKWQRVSPREILLYVGSLLLVQSESPFVSSPSSCRSMSILTLSRDRTLQICRFLNFPELELDHEDILKLYLTLSDSKNPPYFEASLPIDSAPSALTSFLLDELPKQTLLELLKELRGLQIRPTCDQLTRLKHVRNCLRPPEIALWFALQLVLLVVKDHWKNRRQHTRNADADVSDDGHDDKTNETEAENGEDFNVLLARSLLWAGAAPLKELLPDDVHFLEKKRNSNNNKEVVRRLCSQCSTKGAGGNKRSSYFCPRCEKFFCRLGKCFEEYHRQHYYRNYPYLT